MRKTHLLLTAIAALSLTACGATTGSAVKSQAQKTSFKQEAVQQDVITTAVDTNMDCAAISAQMAEADAVMETSRTVIMSGGNSMGGDVGKMAINQGASRALKSVPFGGFLAKSAIKSVASAGAEKAALAKVNFDAANLRKANLSGLYAGKNCGT